MCVSSTVGWLPLPTEMSMTMFVPASSCSLLQQAPQGAPPPVVVGVSGPELNGLSAGMTA
jgi:hypothetical protein